MIPPGIPGYETHPKPALDRLGRARALVGNRRVQLSLYTYEGRDNSNQERGRLVRASLAAIGIDVSVHVIGDPWSFARRHNDRVDMMLDGWVPDFLDPADIINELLDPARLADGLYPPFFKETRWLVRMRAAEKVTGRGRPAAYARLDDELGHGPTPAVPLVFIAGTPQLFSARVACHTFLPQYNGLVDFASLCLK